MDKSRKQTSLMSFFSPKSVSDKVEEKTLSSTPKQKKLIARNVDMSPVINSENGRGSILSKRNMIIESDSDDEENLKKVKVEANDSAKLSEEAEESTDRFDANSSLRQFSFQSNLDSTTAEESLSIVTVSEENATKLSSKKEKLPAFEHDACDKFSHLSFDFLKPENIQDSNRRRPDHAEYDHRTLHVPSSFIQKQTPGHRQWWLIKSKMFDTILFFKVGKFYELYHMDAVVSAKHLNLSYMKGDYAHCGFPESAIGRFSDQLLEAGYKVARIEQTETPEMLEARFKREKFSSKDKVVKREVCRILTKATRMYSYLEGDEEHADSTYLTAVCEKLVDATGKRRIGTCFVNTASGEIYLSEFDDDSACSRLRTVLATFPPAQVLYPKGELSADVAAALKQSVSTLCHEPLKPNQQFLSPTETMRFLSKGAYFNRINDEEQQEICWPEVIESILSQGDKAALMPSSKFVLAISSLGAIVWYLKQCLIDHDVLSLRKIQMYEPPDVARADQSLANVVQNRYMVLDELSLRNLDVVKVCNADSNQSTLFDQIDLCHTSMGKRLLRFWLCSPLYDVEAIKLRQEAVETLLANPIFLLDISNLLRKVPDLERLLQKMHSLAIKKPGTDHPECRAIFFDADKYTKKKLTDFVSLINGLNLAKCISDKFIQANLLPSSKMMRQLLDERHFPNIAADLKHFQTCFDHQKALQDGVVVPDKGTDSKVDQIDQLIAETQHELQEYLRCARKKLNCSNIQYVEGGRNRFQLEIPERDGAKVSREFQLKSQRKGYLRYTSAELDSLVERLSSQEAERFTAMTDIVRRIFARFCSKMSTWYTVATTVATVDVLHSLARYASDCPHNVCKPEFSSSATPFLHLENSVHPCCSKIRTSGGEFIPNDVQLGTSETFKRGQLLLITGANMGGKSTLMRQIGCLVIMAQIGAHVPAMRFRLTPVDRMFTRIGASDSLITGQSTLYVELRETSAILRHARPTSFVIIDELGRGTSTFDGTAIAAATLKFLTERIGCMGIFSTHYHNLMDNFKSHPGVQLGHMACIVENENSDDPVEENITFLYKLSDGPCPKSYGFNAAKLAGLDAQVIRNARAISIRLSKTQALYRELRQAVAKQSEEQAANPKLIVQKLMMASSGTG